MKKINALIFQELKDFLYHYEQSAPIQDGNNLNTQFKQDGKNFYF